MTSNINVLTILISAPLFFLMLHRAYSFTKSPILSGEDSKLKKQRPPLTGPNLSSLTLTPPASASAFLSPRAGPTGAPSPPPRTSIQLSDHSVKARDPLTPQPPAYPVWLSQTQTDGIILLHRLYWGRRSKALGLCPHSAQSQPSLAQTDIRGHTVNEVSFVRKGTEMHCHYLGFSGHWLRLCAYKYIKKQICMEKTEEYHNFHRD